MVSLLAVTIAIHGLSATLWVGGMFFAYICLRPALGAVDPPLRLQLWQLVFQRFFVWVWIVAIVLPITGYIQIIGFYGSFANIGVHIHIMHGLSWVMFCLFALLYFWPYRRFQAAVLSQDWADAANHLNLVRQIVATNLALGVIVIIAATAGRFWN